MPYPAPPSTLYSRLWRELLEPGFEKLRGKRIGQVSALLAQSQGWDLTRLQDWQWSQLAKLLAWAQDKVPYYQDWFFKNRLEAREVIERRDLSLLPLVDRDLVSAQPELFRAAPLPAHSIQKNTGGTTGAPLRLMLDPYSNDWRTAVTRRGYGWAGAHNGNRMLMVWSTDLIPPSPRALMKRRLHHLLLRLKSVSYMNILSPSDADMVMRAVDEFKPISIVTYPSAAEVFCQRALDIGWHPRHKPHSVLTGAETLFPHQREMISQVMQCQVFQTYGSREFMLTGCECPAHDGMHVSEENLMLEILDGERPLGPGQLGEVVITDLHNFAQPFIRYRIGDMASWHSWETCSCGRAHRRIGQVEGKVVDMIQAPDGSKLTGHFFPHLLKDFDAVERYQVVQESLDSVTIRLKLRGRLEHGQREYILNKFREFLPGVEPTIQEVDEVEIAPTGKIRTVIGLGSSSQPKQAGAGS